MAHAAVGGQWACPHEPHADDPHQCLVAQPLPECAYVRHNLRSNNVPENTRQNLLYFFIFCSIFFYWAERALN